MAYSLKMPQIPSRIFFYGVIFIVLISGTLEINQNIANKGTGYFVLKNIEQANEAAKLGYIKYEVNDYAETFGLPWKSEPGVRRIIRSGPDDFDDIGYISMLELIALAGKKITLLFVENLHNIIFVISLVFLSFLVKRLYKNIFAGWLFLILALIFKSKILSFVYGSPDSRTFTIFFPCIAITLIFLLSWLKPQLLKAKAILVVLAAGLAIGIMTLIRYSEGMPVLYTVIILILLFGIKIRHKITLLALLFLTYFLVIFGLPIVFALHRDIKTGEFTGNLKPYMRTTGNHPAWHSLTVGIGKYKNKLGMRYYDLVCYDIVRSRYPETMHPKLNIQGKGYYDALRKIYFKYVFDHPFEYAFNMAKSFAELFYFIPYATSAGNLPWQYGYLPIKPGVEALEIDKTPSFSALINLRFWYLKIGFTYWLAFLFAIFNILAVAFLMFRQKTVQHKTIFLAIAIYLGLLSIQRAIVPQHGLTLLTTFWLFSVICFLYIIFTENAVKYIIRRYWMILSNKIKWYWMILSNKIKFCSLPAPVTNGVKNFTNLKSSAALKKISSIGLVIPCYNEAKRLNSLSFLKALEINPSLTLLFVNDGSTDNTLSVIEKLCVNNPARALKISLIKNSGKAEAVRQGMLYLSKSDKYDVIGFWDADLAVPLSEINDFIQIFNKNLNIKAVIASRVHLAGRLIERVHLRHYFGRLFATIVDLTFDIRVYDTQCGAKLFDSQILKAALEEPFFTNWIFDVELIIRLTRMLNNNWWLYELPVNEWRNVSGTKRSFSAYMTAFVDYLILVRKYLR